MENLSPGLRQRPELCGKKPMRWHRRLFEGFEVKDASGAVIPLSSFCGLDNLGDRNWVHVYNPKGSMSIPPA